MNETTLRTKILDFLLENGETRARDVEIAGLTKKIVNNKYRITPPKGRNKTTTATQFPSAFNKYLKSLDHRCSKASIRYKIWMLSGFKNPEVD